MKIALLVACLAGLGAGCASVGKDWKTASRQPPPTDDISGAWEGSWTSEKSGHTGRLKGLLTKKTETEYEAWFHATFWKIFSTRYAVPLDVVRREATDFHLEGTTRIGGMMGGEYRYRAVASPTHFSSTYNAESDYGTFEMKRVGIAQQPR